MLGLGGSASALSAQSGIGVHTMGQVTLVGGRANPTPYGGPLTEVRIVAPVLAGIATFANGHGVVSGTVNFERWTIPDGVLNAGGWGEGFVDRRHPHTTFHELVLAGTDLLGKRDGVGDLGVVLGKGFAPFGSDDPMNRPFVAFPVNHHWAQVLERAVGIIQYRFGAVTAEGGLFDGDEPEHPEQWPLLRLPDGRWRFGDSRAARVTIRPTVGLEVQGSAARVFSPEFRYAGGGYAIKSSASVRWQDHHTSTGRYAMAEWARTSEYGGVFSFRSFLAEGQLSGKRVSVAYRFESTDRPEEERIDGRFRTLRPHIEYSILGVSRWNLHTVHLTGIVPTRLRGVVVLPFLEVTAGRVSKIGGGIVDPESMYRGGSISQLSLGVTLDWHMRNHRMGRYGSLAEPKGTMPGMTHGEHAGS